MPVAQLDRVTGYEPVGRGFESLQARHKVAAKRCSPKNLGNTEVFLLSIGRFLSRPFYRCKIAVFPLQIDLNSCTTENETQAHGNQKSMCFLLPILEKNTNEKIKRFRWCKGYRQSIASDRHLHNTVFSNDCSTPVYLKRFCYDSVRKARRFAADRHNAER